MIGGILRGCEMARQAEVEGLAARLFVTDGNAQRAVSSMSLSLACARESNRSHASGGAPQPWEEAGRV